MSYRRILISGSEAAKNTSLADGLTIAHFLFLLLAEYTPTGPDTALNMEELPALAIPHWPETVSEYEAFTSSGRSHQSSPGNSLKRYRTPSTDWDGDDEASEIVYPNAMALEENPKQTREKNYGRIKSEAEGEIEKSEPIESSKEYVFLRTIKRSNSR